MSKMTRKLVYIFTSLLLASNFAVAETITATCYNPAGKRIDYLDGKKDISDDGYSNSNPTFFYTSKDPKVLIESWQTALPFPDLLDRESLDEISPPSVTKSIVVSYSDTIIQAISISGGDSYTTTLYLKEGKGIFTRVRLEIGELDSPMGAIYSAECNINFIQ